jgi:hypothetical protein
VAGAAVKAADKVGAALIIVVTFTGEGGWDLWDVGQGRWKGRVGMGHGRQEGRCGALAGHQRSHVAQPRCSPLQPAPFILSPTRLTAASVIPPPPPPFLAQARRLPWWPSSVRRCQS